MASWCYAQQLPLDFSQSSDTFTAFSNSGFSFNTDPEDSSNDVGQFFNDGSQPWQGFFIDFPQQLNLSTQQVFTISFYQFDPNAHSIMIKLEQGTEADVEVVQNTSGSGWKHDITFDFSNAIVSGSGTPINATGSYNRLTIFIDGGVLTSGTYLLDDINNGSTPTDPNALDVIYTDLVWSDEFDYNGAIDNTKWFHQTQLPAGGSWFNGEVQHYTNRLDNSFVDGNYLNIVAKKETFTDQGETKAYTSARLNSKYAFTYGRVDIRAKLPEGDGTWPALWTLGKNIIETGAYWQTQGFGTTSWPACGELDIMEHGLYAENQVNCAIHTPSSFGATVNTSTQFLPDVSNNFHVYSMNWSPNQITFLIDGVGYYTYNPAVKDANTWPFDLDQYLLLNVAMGGVAGTIDPNFTESSMIIDYVRVYQNILNIDEVAFYNTFSLSPNPVESILHINTPHTINKLEVYNILGKLVLQPTTIDKKIDIKSLDSGLYILKIYSDEQSVTKKFIKN